MSEDLTNKIPSIIGRKILNIRTITDEELKYLGFTSNDSSDDDNRLIIELEGNINIFAVDYCCLADRMDNIAQIWGVDTKNKIDFVVTP